MRHALGRSAGSRLNVSSTTTNSRVSGPGALFGGSLLPDGLARSKAGFAAFREALSLRRVTTLPARLARPAR